ncbi:MAG: hypothetical protein DLM63_05610 [Solirubrobacterales bacterium]|nr:MAG: hypothetical protein DLM63_05610 [Solirubrobacterales bacterium]
MSPAEAPQPDDGLARLRERIEATRRAAERVAGDLDAALGPRPEASGGDEADPSAPPPPAGAPGSAAGRPPSMGYAAPPPPPAGSTLSELESLARRLRDLLPEELARELAELVRELLLLVRALIDWTLERLDRRRAAAVEVTDIPIA